MPRQSGHILATYQSSSGTGGYEIREGGDGVVYCTCTGWRMRRTCRHLTDWSQGGSGASAYMRSDGVLIRVPAGHGPINPHQLERGTPAPRSATEALTADNIMDRLTRRARLRNGCSFCGDTLKFEGEGNWRCVHCDNVQGVTADFLISCSVNGTLTGLRREPRRQYTIPTPYRHTGSGTYTAEPVPTSVGSAPVLNLRPRYWDVYEGDHLVGKVTGTSKAEVLALFIRSSGSGIITVKETR